MSLSRRKQEKVERQRRVDKVERRWPRSPLDAHIEADIRHYLDTGEAGSYIHSELPWTESDCICGEASIGGRNPRCPRHGQLTDNARGAS